jgi:hypothetical protein
MCSTQVTRQVMGAAVARNRYMKGSTRYSRKSSTVISLFAGCLETTPVLGLGPITAKSSTLGDKVGT